MRKSEKKKRNKYKTSSTGKNKQTKMLCNTTHVHEPPMNSLIGSAGLQSIVRLHAKQISS